MSGVVIELSGLVGSGVVVLVRSWDGSLGVVVGVLGIVSRVTGCEVCVLRGTRRSRWRPQWWNHGALGLCWCKLSHVVDDGSSFGCLIYRDVFS